MTDWMNDADALEEQYADASNLNARIALHERYSTAEHEFWPWVFDQFALRERAFCYRCRSARGLRTLM